MKHFFIFLLIFLNINVLVYAKESEEELCFQTLNEQVKKDPRFSWFSKILVNWDLSEVLYDEWKWSYLDLSDYKSFSRNLVTNPAHVSQKVEREKKGLTATDFLARRNNIATVIASDNYVVSQIVGFWRDSTFDFPVSAKATSYGDKYRLNGRFFKEFVLYTHHSITWDFLSCGLFHLTPLGGRQYSEVAETWYFTNTLQGNESQPALSNKKCSSGFEGEYLNKSGEKFYSMKTNVCALDYAQKDFVRMEILTVAYDNKSDFFNEYVVFPLQVEVMRDTDTTRWGLITIEDTFLDYLTTRTCLSLVHKNKSTLPKKCDGKYSWEVVYDATINNKLVTFFKNIIPQTSAAREFNFTQEDITASQWVVKFDSFPLDLYKKLESIPNPSFVEYIKLALSPNLEDYILYRKENNIVLSPYEEVFLACWLSYADRQDIIIDFLENVKDVNNFDTTQLSYKNPKFWDCVVPYPDKRNLSKKVEGSFPSNQLLAEVLSWEYKGPVVSESVTKMIQEQNELQTNYQNKIDEFTRQFNEGHITSEQLQAQIQTETKTLEQEMKQVEENYSKDIVNSTAQSLNSSGINASVESQIDFKIYIFIIVLVLIGGLFIVLAIKNKK